MLKGEVALPDDLVDEFENLQLGDQLRATQLSGAEKDFEGLSKEFAHVMTLLQTSEFRAQASGWTECQYRAVRREKSGPYVQRVYKLGSRTCRFPGSMLADGMTTAVNVAVLFDTGAEGAYVNRKMLEYIEAKCDQNISLRLRDTPVRAVSANGAILCWYEVSVLVDVGGFQEVVDCVVLPDCGEHIILGYEHVAPYWERLKTLGKFTAKDDKTILLCIPSGSLDSMCKVIYRGDPEDPFGYDKQPELEDSPLVASLSEAERVAAIKAKNEKAWSELISHVDPDVRALLTGDDGKGGFNDVFTEVLEAVPEVRGKDHGCRIELTSSLLTSIVKVNYLSQDEERLAADTVQQLLDSDIIEVCTGDRFVSPLLFVAKGESEKRMCIDYRLVNAIVALHQGVIPLISEMLKAVTGHKYISAVDLTSAFHQVRIHPDDRDVTTFRHGDVHYRFKLLPFGLTVSPIIMQQKVAALFRGIPNVLNYIDDIVIFTKDRTQHLETIRRVLTRCREQKFFLKASKCEFLKSSLKFLGYEVLVEGITIPQDRLDAFRRLAPPTSPKEMQRTLGMFNYFRDFVPGFADLARLLQKYAAEPKAREMTEEEHKDFRATVDALIACVPLKPFIDAPFVLETDASGVAVGAVLYQRRGKELYGPVAVMSKSLDIHQQLYPVRQKELYAIFLALKRWRVWVLGRRIDVYTDHQSLTHFMTAHTRPEIQRLSGWLEHLQEFDLHVHYLKGEDNLVADYLSCCILPAKEELYRAGLLDRIKVYERYVKTVQRHGTALRKPKCKLLEQELEKTAVTRLVMELTSDAIPRIKKAYKTDPLARELFKHWDKTPPAQRSGSLFETAMRKMVVTDSRLLLYGNKPYVPKRLAKEFIRQVHELAHQGITKLWVDLHLEWYTPYLFDVIRQVVTHCVTCQRQKKYRMPALPLRMLTPPKRPFDVIHIDYVSVSKSSYHPYDSVLTVVDSFSKFVIFIPARKDDSSEIVARLLITEVFSIFGLPKNIVSDNGTNLIQGAMPLLLRWIGAKPSTTTPGHPQANGEAERANQTIITMLRTLADRSENNWPVFLKLAQLEFNRSYTRAHRMTPFEVVFGYPPRKFLDLGLMLNELGELSDVIFEYRRIVREAAAAALDDHQVEVAAKYNATHNAREPSYHKGDYVLVHKDCFFSHRHAEWKMQDCYFGPYRIVREPDESNNSFLVALDFEGVTIQGGECPDPKDWFAYQRVNAEHLRPYKVDPELVCEPPTTKAGFKANWDAVNGIAYVDTTYSWVGLFMAFLEPGQVAHCKAEWFRAMDFRLTEFFVTQYVLLHASPKDENIMKIFRNLLYRDPPKKRLQDLQDSEQSLAEPVPELVE